MSTPSARSTVTQSCVPWKTTSTTSKPSAARGASTSSRTRVVTFGSATPSPRPLRGPPPEGGAGPDRHAVGGHHAQGRPDPRAHQALGGGQGDGGEHRLVAQLGQEEGDGRRNHRRSGRPSRLARLVVVEPVAP